MNSTKTIGDKGELIAIKYLKKNKYNIKTTNFKFGRFGEIDIVSEIDGITCFIEVKYRNNTSFGIPEESITKFKLSRFRKTIEYYVVTNNLDFEKIRFDVISILKGRESYKVKHYKNLEI